MNALLLAHGIGGHLDIGRLATIEGAHILICVAMCGIGLVALVAISMIHK